MNENFKQKDNLFRFFLVFLQKLKVSIQIAMQKGICISYQKEVLASECFCSAVFSLCADSCICSEDTQKLKVNKMPK